MSNHRFTVLAAVAVLAASVTSAQSEPGPKTSFRRYAGPLHAVELDLETGVVTRGASVRPRSASTAATFSNLDLGGFVGADTGSCACEWYDAGTKSGGRSTYLSGFRFVYCSAALDPLSGGPGGAAELSFRTGYTFLGNGFFQPPNGTEVARLALTGLPANTSCSSFFGGFQCYFTTVRLGATFCLADGAIGYGWKFLDLGTDGVLAKTFPFLSCVQSCSGPGPDGLGMINCIDRYCPPGHLLGSFTTCTGTVPFGVYFNSMSMELRELSSTGAMPSASYVTSNPGVLSDNAGSLGFGPNIGDLAEPFGLALDCSAATTAGAWFIHLRPGLIPAGVPSGLGLVAGSGPLLLKLSGVHAQGPVATPTVALPKHVAFACVPYTSQGWCQSAPRGFLSNALRETIGVP